MFRFVPRSFAKEDLLVKRARVSFQLLDLFVLVGEQGDGALTLRAHFAFHFADSARVALSFFFQLRRVHTGHFLKISSVIGDLPRTVNIKLPRG